MADGIGKASPGVAGWLSTDPPDNCKPLQQTVGLSKIIDVFYKIVNE
jgi:hypothetical protein